MCGVRTIRALRSSGKYRQASRHALPDAGPRPRRLALTHTLQPSLYDTSYIATSAWPTDCLGELRQSVSIDSQATSFRAIQSWQGLQAGR